jgi:oligopeptide/dipeptide ABC transporter ATP-binding protein
MPGPDLAPGARLQEIPGMVPALGAWPAGCKFVDRCPGAQPRCHAEEPALTTLGASLVRCHFPLAPAEASS